MRRFQPTLARRRPVQLVSRIAEFLLQSRRLESVIARRQDWSTHRAGEGRGSVPTLQPPPRASGHLYLGTWPSRQIPLLLPCTFAV